MSEDWCKAIEQRLGLLEERLTAIESGNQRLIQIVVVSSLAIISAVVGVKLV